MRQALCVAYYKAALAQGDPRHPSLGDYAGAEVDMRKAESILMPAYQRHSADPDYIMRLIEVRSGLADLMFQTGRIRQATQLYEQLIPVAHRIGSISHCTMNCKQQEPALENNLAHMLLNIAPDEALRHIDRSVALLRVVAAAYPQEVDVHQQLAVGIGTAAAVNAALGRLQQADEGYRQSIAMREPIMRTHPDNAAYQRGMLVILTRYAMLLGSSTGPHLDRPEDAMHYATQAVDIARRLAAADPGSITSKRDLATALWCRGAIDGDVASAASALQDLQEADALMLAVSKASPNSTESAITHAGILQQQGRWLARLGHTTDAVNAYRQSIAQMDPFMAVEDANLTLQRIASEQDLAQLYANSGDTAQALPLAERALQQAQNFIAATPSTAPHTAMLGLCWAVDAMVLSQANRNEDASYAAENAMKLWDSIERSGLLSVYQQEMTQMRRLLAAASSH